MLEITFTRTRPRACATTVRRDRASFELHGFGRTAELPHDLAHYEVERALGLRHGFWGCVAAGATFQSMTLVQGRRQPAWAERSRELLRRHRGELTEADGGAPIGPPHMWRACQALATAGARWRALPTGGTLTVTWPDAPERARGRRRARPSTARRALA
jgi:hypothetical protein